MTRLRILVSANEANKLPKTKLLYVQNLLITSLIVDKRWQRNEDIGGIKKVGDAENDKKFVVSSEI